MQEQYSNSTARRSDATRAGVGSRGSSSVREVSFPDKLQQLLGEVDGFGRIAGGVVRGLGIDCISSEQGEVTAAGEAVPDIFLGPACDEKFETRRKSRPMRNRR